MKTGAFPDLVDRCGRIRCYNDVTVAAAVVPDDGAVVAAFHASPAAKAKKIDAFPHWVLLDRSVRVFCYNDKDAAAAAVEGDAAAVAVETSNGSSGYFSFNLRAAPRVSYVDLHWPYGLPKSVVPYYPAISTIVSADGPLLLLNIEISEGATSYNTPTEMFVYTAGTSSPPSLCRLPLCTLRPEGLSSTCLFLKQESGVQIMCRGGKDDYIVADLRVSWKAGGDPCGGINPSPAIAMVCFFSSKIGEWRTHEMIAPQPQGLGQFPFFWSSDRACTFAGRYIYWVDYFSGILLADMSKDDSTVLSYIPFPGKQYPLDDQVRFNRFFPEALRSVSVSEDKVYFVQIDPELITIWTLNTTTYQNFSWEINCVINLNVLWTDHGYQAQDLLHHPPKFPVVVKDDDSSVLCCVLRESECFWTGKAWVIMLDTKNAAFRSCVPYINEHVPLFFEGDDMNNGTYLRGAFLPSDFSKHLNKQPDNRTEDTDGDHVDDNCHQLS